MTKKGLIFLLALIVSLLTAGCSKNDPTNTQIKSSIENFQKDMVRYYDMKGLQDSSLLVTKINDYINQLKANKDNLDQLVRLVENVKDEKLKAELGNFIDLSREREKLTLKYLEDIRRDINYKYRSPDAQVNINDYISKIPDKLLDLEYRSEQSRQRLNTMLNKK